jgi:hypothetical protein
MYLEIRHQWSDQLRSVVNQCPHKKYRGSHLSFAKYSSNAHECIHFQGLTDKDMARTMLRKGTVSSLRMNLFIYSRQQAYRNCPSQCFTLKLHGMGLSPLGQRKQCQITISNGNWMLNASRFFINHHTAGKFRRSREHRSPVSLSSQSTVPTLGNRNSKCLESRIISWKH